MIRAEATPHAPVPDKREAVLEAALALFAEQGFHGTTMPDVAAKAHVGAGTIYRYFESKEALVNVLFQRWKAELTRTLAEDLPVDKGLREMFHQLWTRLARFAQENRQVYAFLELHHHGPYLDDESRRIEAQLLEMLNGFVQTGVDSGVFKPLSPAVLIAIAYGAMTGLVKASWLHYLTLTPKLIEQTEACVWETIAKK